MCDLTHIQTMTHSSVNKYVWQDSFICVTWLIHMCDMTHHRIMSGTGIQDSDMATHIQMCDKTHSYVITYGITQLHVFAYECVMIWLWMRLTYTHLHIWMRVKHLHIWMRVTYLHIWMRVTYGQNTYGVFTYECVLRMSNAILNYTCDMTHLQNITHLYVNMCDTTHSYVWHDSSLDYERHRYTGFWHGYTHSNGW